MNRIVIILAISVLFPFLSRGADHKVQWKKATDFYLQKQYDSAAHYFDLVAASKPDNAEVYYNLGNTYYRLNKIALAAVNYERALWIDPSYTEARENLAITQARISHHIAVAEDIFFIAWWKSITAHTHSTSLAVAALISFMLVMLAIWIRRFTSRGAKIPVQLPGILGFVCLVFLLLGTVASFRSLHSDGAVIAENDAPLMNAELKGKPLALIPEGTTVKVSAERGMWVEISLPDGRTGWLLQSQIIKI